MECYATLEGEKEFVAFYRALLCLWWFPLSFSLIALFSFPFRMVCARLQARGLDQGTALYTVLHDHYV